MTPRPQILLAAACLVILARPCSAAEIAGAVAYITDGDTLHVIDASNSRHKIRLSGIDAPECKQPFGKQAKEHLADLLAGEPVRVIWEKRDRYQRIVGQVIHDGRDINLLMVRDGLAWWYRRYADEQSPVDRVLYENAERSAKAARRGLWSRLNPQPPWTSRR